MIWLYSVLIVLVFWYEPIEATQICLSMIVKNESHVIQRALASARPLIDSWVIIDTGSTDGTQEVIRDYMQDIPGVLIERPWKNFAHNRNEALILAQQQGDYVLFLDADDHLEYDRTFQRQELSADAYTLWWHLGDGFTYQKPQLIKATLPWHWEGVWHEYLTCDVQWNQQPLNGVTYQCGRDGASSKDPNKYLKAVEALEQALEEDPTNSRYMFYLAESLACAGRQEEAIEWYQRRVALGGWQEEVFWSLLQKARLQEALSYNLHDVLHSYECAHRFRPHRIEPIYHVSRLLNQHREFSLAYSRIKGFYSIPQPRERDILFNEEWMEHYGILVELSVAAYYLGYLQEFEQITSALLEQRDLPSSWRIIVENNATYIPRMPAGEV